MKRNYTIVIVFSIAFLFRAYFIHLFLLENTATEILTFFPDSTRYLEAAYYLLGWETSEKAIMFSGPGYPLFLAINLALFGFTAWPILGIQIILSCCTAVFIVLITKSLFNNLEFGHYLAGILSAISLTSISLSGVVLTETLFIFTFSALLYCLIRGLSTGMRVWFLISGILSGYCILTRPMFQYWPIFIIAWIIITPSKRFHGSKKRLFFHLLLFLSVSSIVISPWIIRNYSNHGVFTLSSGGVSTARYYWTAKALSELTPNSTISSVRKELWGIENLTWRNQKSDVKEEIDSHKKVIKDTFIQYPLLMIRAYVTSVRINILERNRMHVPQIQALKPFWIKLVPYQTLWSKVVAISSIFGLFLVLRKRGFGLEFSVLTSTYLYFALMSGFAFHKGNRIIFPAHVSWMPLFGWLIEKFVYRPLSCLHSNFFK